jgi:hypothetical protein
MSSPDERTLRLRVVCVQPPPAEHSGQPTTFGLQDKKQNLQPGIEQADGSIYYDLAVRARWDAATNRPRFLGPFVQGATQTPFLYLSWRPDIADAPWIKRLKVSLTTITWPQVEAATATPNARLEAGVDGRGAASVPLLGEGWILRSD